MKVRCPGCRKKSTVPDTDVGQLAVCAACGVRYQIPEPGLEPAESIDRKLRAAGVDPAVALSRRWLGESFWLGIGLAAFAVVLSVVWLVAETQQHNRRDAFAQAVESKTLAADAANRRLWAVAGERYADTERLIAQQSPITPEWQRLLDEVHAGQTAVNRELFRATGREASGGSSSRAVAAAANAKAANAPPHPATEPAIPKPAMPTAVALAKPPPANPPATRPTAVNPPVTPSVPGPPAEPTSRPVAVVPPNRPPIHPVAATSDDLTDEQIGRAIQLGVNHLVGQFDPRTHLLRALATDQDGPTRGADILCVYALMQCGMAIDDPRLSPKEDFMKGLLTAMKALPLDHYRYETYARGLRSTALSLYNRPEDHYVIAQDAAALVKGHTAGGYTYELHHGPGLRDTHFDNSNSQYGLLGVWSAAEVGYEVPDGYWEAVERHWNRTQCSNGQWDYREPAGSGTHSMTCAGLASLFVTHEYLDLPRFGAGVGREPYTAATARGLAWLEQGDNAVELNHGGYDLYGLERVGLASGFKYFGRHDWFRELAKRSIGQQKRDGSWGSSVETAYNLLFLSRGRHPILMNKLRYAGYWDNYPRDLANLARFTGHQLERPLNWQVVPLDHDWKDWTDSPILYLASHKPPKLSQADVDKIRQFVLNGGMLFTHADGASPEFVAFARDLAHKLFPAYELQPLPANHPLCSVLFKVQPTPAVKIVTNGSRVLMLDCEFDLSKFWQLRDEKHKGAAFQFGTDLFLYASGRRDLRNRLVSSYIPQPTEKPTTLISVARLSYTGNWDPEPVAWQRFGRRLQWKTGYGLDVKDVAIRDLKPQTCQLAVLTGNARYDLTPAESAAIKRFVEAGGVLFVDLCGGSGAFDKSMESTLYFREFASNPGRVIPSSHPLLSAGAPGMEDLSRPRLRQFASDILGSHAGLPEIISAGKGHVIYTSLDVTTALLGTGTWGIMGYEPTYAQSLLKNTLLWTLDGQPDGQRVANGE